MCYHLLIWNNSLCRSVYLSVYQFSCVQMYWCISMFFCTCLWLISLPTFCFVASLWSGSYCLIRPINSVQSLAGVCVSVLLNTDDGEREEETKVCDHQIMGFLCVSPLGSQPSVVQSRPMCVFSCLLHVQDLETVSFALCSIVLVLVYSQQWA